MVDNKLYKGIFWLIGNELFSIKALCDASGTILENIELTSKLKTNFNHKFEWEKLERKTTKGKAFNYYPRGRVEIKNGVAKIFLNGKINTDEIISNIIEAFQLKIENGIKNIKVIEDNSFHYLCHLDSAWKEN